MKTTIELKLNYIEISGQALLNLWGGGQGVIEMKTIKLKPEKATKNNILRCVNDNGFGCESIQSASIDITSVYGNGHCEYIGALEIDHPIHTNLFLGWRYLNESQAIYKTHH